jgi:membrane glycosyltransferase
VLLFLPKLLSIFLVRPDRAHRYGGTVALLASVLGEIVASALLAPIRMLFHTRFVVMALAGWSVQWKSPPREDAQTSWGEAVRRHGLHTAFGVVWAGAVYLLNPAFLWWLLPVAGALIVSIPMSVYTSRATLGVRARRAGLFLIPEETNPPPEILATQQYVRETAGVPGFVDAVVDPAVNATMAALPGARPLLPSASREQRHALVERALAEGAASLSRRDRSLLLGDGAALAVLHERVRTDAAGHASWRAVPAAAT